MNYDSLAKIIFPKERKKGKIYDVVEKGVEKNDKERKRDNNEITTDTVKNNRDANYKTIINKSNNKNSII